MPDRLYIRAIRDQTRPQRISGVYAVQNCQLGATRNGKSYLKGLLGDKTGQTALRMWNASEDLFATLPTNGFVRIEGQSQPYQGEMQIIVERIAAHEPTDAELRELLPASRRGVDAMFAELVTELGKITHPALASLRDRYLEDGALMDRFSAAPAAQSMHHAYLGGLLEHTLQLLQLADRILPLYPALSPDLVRLGLFLHDTGKCVELTWERGFGYSTDGQLVGHIVRGSHMLADKARACENPELGEAALAVPEPILTALHHIILSHHGVPEFGAAKRPATPEAMFISLLDNLDAKMNMTLAAARPGEEAPGKPNAAGHEFTEKVWALGTRLYKPDPTKTS